MSGFNERLRLTKAEAYSLEKYQTPMIAHLLTNEDETYSIMYHINCEWCDYCEQQGDARGMLHGEVIVPMPAKENPYELQESKGAL